MRKLTAIPVIPDDGRATCPHLMWCDRLGPNHNQSGWVCDAMEQCVGPGSCLPLRMERYNTARGYLPKTGGQIPMKYVLANAKTNSTARNKAARATEAER
jgi:hypothetical protein